MLVDEATGEQLKVSIRWVSHDYEVSKDPVGLHCFPSTTSEVLYTAVTGILTWCNLPLALCRGPAFDGAANIQK